MRTRIRDAAWTVEALEGRVLLATVDVPFLAANHSTKDPHFALQGPSETNRRTLQVDLGAYQQEGPPLYDPKGLGSLVAGMPLKMATRSDPSGGTVLGFAQGAMSVLALKVFHPQVKTVEQYVSDVLVPPTRAEGFVVDEGPEEFTIPWQISGGVWDGRELRLKGQTVKLVHEDAEATAEHETFAELRLYVFQIGTDPEGNTQYCWFKVDVTTDVHTTDARVFPLGDVASELLSAASLREYSTNELDRVEAGLKYSGAVPDTLLLYDFSAQSTVAPGSLPYVNQYELTTAPVQGEAACGPSSLTMALAEIGRTVTVQSAWDNTIQMQPRGFNWDKGDAWVKSLGNSAKFRYYDTWANVDANLNAGRPVLIGNVLSTTNVDGGGHLLLLLGVGENPEVKAALKQLDPSSSGDYYIVADPAGHFFANPDQSNAHYGTVLALRALAMGINYGGWFAIYPKEKLKSKVESTDANGTVIRTLTLNLPSPAVSTAAHSPVAVVVTDPLGRRVGVRPDGSILNEIPDSEYHPAVIDDAVAHVTTLSPQDGKFVVIGTPVEGTYTAELTGTGNGPFTFDIDIQRPGHPLSRVTYSGTASPGSVHTYQFSYPPGAAGAEVVGRSVFYNNSSFDGNTAGPDARDDGAVAPDKRAMRAGPALAPAFANVTTYSKGINGVMVDVRGLPAAASITPETFTFRAGTVADVAAWAAAPPPSQVSVRRGAGVGGSDRITLVWPDGALRNTWLQVTLPPVTATGLTAPDVFYFGNLVGDTGDGAAPPFRVNALDLSAVKRAINTTSDPAGRLDFNRDGRVNALDLAAVRSGLNRTLGGPTAAQSAAPWVGGLALVSATARLAEFPRPIPVWDEPDPEMLR